MIKGSQSTSFDHAIFNVSDVQDNHTILYFKNLNLNGNLVNGLSDPVDNNDATNKIYVDAEIAKLPKPDTDVLKLDGSKAMTGNLDMDGHNILSVKNLTDHKVDDAYSDIVKDLKSVVNKEYLNQNFLKIKGNDYDLNQRVIKNSAPHDDGSYDNNTLVSKAFVDAEIAKLPKPDTDVLKLDGSKSMTGNLNMGMKNILNIDTLNDYTDNSEKDRDLKSAVNKEYLNTHFLKIMGKGDYDFNLGGQIIKNCGPYYDGLFDDNSLVSKAFVDSEIKKIPGVATDVLKLDGSKAMTGALDMGNHNIINLKDPTTQSHAVNKKFVDGAILNSNFSIISSIYEKIKQLEEKSIHSVNKENVFNKVMADDEFKEDDDDIHKAGVQNKDFHSVNKKTYEFKIDYDSSEGDGEYSTRLSIDLIYLPTGSYTMVYEMYIDDGLTVDQIDASSGTLKVENINSKIDGTHTRSIIHFIKYSLSSGFDDLDIDIKLKGKTDPQTTIYVVVYGVKGQVNNVPVNLWDRFYFYDNNNSTIKYEVPINMNNKDITGTNKLYADHIDVNYIDLNYQINMNSKKIVNLADSTDNGDAVNRKQFSYAITHSENKILLNESRIDNIINRLKYYYFTDDLQHDNKVTVRFPSGIDSYPFKSVSDDTLFRILLDGHYQIIYTDFYIGNGLFKIHDDTNGNNLFVLDFNTQNIWTPITIHAVIPINVDNGFNHVDIKLYIDSSNSNTKLDGAGYSTFFIKYLNILD